MRWLLAKDLLILRRSRLLVALLIVYPVAIALLIGLAISRTPSRPRVAIVDQTPPGLTVDIGSERVAVSRYVSELFSQVEAVPASSRARAVAKVRDGSALAAVVIPADVAARLSSGFSQARLEVIYNGDALEQSIVRSAIDSALARANAVFSQEIQRAASRALGALLSGGDVHVLGAPPNLIGLRQIPSVLSAIIAQLPPGSDRTSLERINQFARFGAENLTASRDVLATVGQPITAETTLLQGRRTPLDAFAVVVAVSISEMFMCVLLAAGGVALEREENALERLLRGLVSRTGLLAEKSLLAAGSSLLVAFAMLAGIGTVVTLQWSRAGLWLAALAVAAVAFATLGVAIGVLAREVRAASLLAILLALPLAFLALVPAGGVSGGIFSAIGTVSFVFPFKAALQALDAAVNGSAPSIGGPLVHLAALGLVFGALARIGLRRAG